LGAHAQGHRGAPRIAVARDLDVVRELFREYGDSLEEHRQYLVGFDDEVERLPDGYDVILVAGGEGCVALRRLDERACEMKRLYVRPAARGSGTGRGLVAAAIEHARGRGYEVMRLDTLPAMAEAATLYGSLGFVETDRYNDNPAPGVRFMELDLRPPRTGT